MANRFFPINLDKDQPYGEKKKNLTGSFLHLFHSLRL